MRSGNGCRPTAILRTQSTRSRGWPGKWVQIPHGPATVSGERTSIDRLRAGPSLPIGATWRRRGEDAGVARRSASQETSSTGPRPSPAPIRERIGAENAEEGSWHDVRTPSVSTASHPIRIPGSGSLALAALLTSARRAAGPGRHPARPGRGPDGRRVAGAQVTVSGPLAAPVTSSTDADGRFLARRLPAGARSTVRALAPGHGRPGPAGRGRPRRPRTAASPYARCARRSP